MGEPVIARIEAIAANKLRENDLLGCRLSYGDAALLEIYRESLSGVASYSMLGQCCWLRTVSTPTLRSDVDYLTMQMQMQLAMTS